MESPRKLTAETPLLRDIHALCAKHGFTFRGNKPFLVSLLDILKSYDRLVMRCLNAEADKAQLLSQLNDQQQPTP